MSPKPPSPCRWKKCQQSAAKLINGVPLCQQHFDEANALTRERTWPKFLRLLASKVTAESARDLELQADRYDEAAKATPDVVKASEKPGGAA